MTDSAKKYLLKLYQERTPDINDYLVYTDKKRQSNILRKCYIRLCEQAEIKNPQGLHTLRHLNATLLINSGVDVKTVQSCLGHSVATTTLNLYCHTFQTAQAAAMEAVAEALPLNCSTNCKEISIDGKSLKDAI